MRKRFEFFKNDFLYLIHDNETNIDYTDFDYDILSDLLNKQDEEIKKNANALRGIIRNCGNTSCELKNSKAIEVLNDILVNLCSKYSTIFAGDEAIRVITVSQISDFINNQITELKGENNGKF